MDPDLANLHLERAGLVRRPDLVLLLPEIFQVTRGRAAGEDQVLAHGQAGGKGPCRAGSLIFHLEQQHGPRPWSFLPHFHSDPTASLRFAESATWTRTVHVLPSCSLPGVHSTAATPPCSTTSAPGGRSDKL